MPLAWTEADFESMSWHDNCVHTFGIVQGEDRTGSLVLDIDYILEWVLDPTGSDHRFRLAPATLTFLEVSALVVDIDYAVSNCGIWAPSISAIERQALNDPAGSQGWRWRIDFSWPVGSIVFVGLGFSQVLRTDPIVCLEQRLSVAERDVLLGP